jgi:isopentenyl diphosphate isomerase/L-lactate dehydrogenase-like FMN-dependent dehydrogenase
VLGQRADAVEVARQGRRQEDVGVAELAALLDAQAADEVVGLSRKWASR